jgi:hypothetical protein
LFASNQKQKINKLEIYYIKMSVIKNFAFGVVIFLLTLFVGIYGINTFYGKGPSYEDFCPQYLGNETACAAVGGNWAASGTEVMNGKPAPVGN